MGEEAVLRDEFTFELETACEIERFIWRGTADESVRFLRDTLADVATAQCRRSCGQTHPGDLRHGRQGGPPWLFLFHAEQTIA